MVLVSTIRQQRVKNVFHNVLYVVEAAFLFEVLMLWSLDVRRTAVIMLNSLNEEMLEACYEHGKHGFATGGSFKLAGTISE